MRLPNYVNVADAHDHKIKERTVFLNSINPFSRQFDPLNSNLCRIVYPTHPVQCSQQRVNEKFSLQNIMAPARFSSRGSYLQLIS